MQNDLHDDAQLPAVLGGPPAVDPRLLELLVCPLTKGRLVYDREAGELVSESAHLAYPIRDGVPIMLVSEARQIEI
ncbi:MAG: Trm112 family protein [Pararhizobium sp.]